jgi:hypothetical protein
MRRWLRRLIVLATFAVVLALPPAHWRLIGSWRGEPFYNGRPASFYRPLVHVENLPKLVCLGPLVPDEWPVIRSVFGDQIADWLQGDRRQLFNRDPAAVPMLTALLRDPDWDVRLAAMWWLGHIEPAAEPALPGLRQLQTEWDDAMYNRRLIDETIAMIEKPNPADEGRP